MKIIEGPSFSWKGMVSLSSVKERALIDTEERSQQEGLDTVQEKINGTNNLRKISILQKAIQLSNSVAHITLRGGAATGFMITENLLLTNNHVFENEQDASNAIIRFNYQTDIKGNQLPTESFECDPTVFFKTNEALDYSIVHVRNSPGLKWGFIRLSKDVSIGVGDDVFIIQHPNGEDKQVGLSDNICAYVDDTVIQYLTDTLPGSSGSAVFDDQFNLVGLHHSGGWLPEPKTGSTYYRNEGIRISKILEDAPMVAHLDRGVISHA